MINKEELEKIKNKLSEMYKDNLTIMDILNKIEVSEYNQVNNAWKILSNPRIMNAVNSENNMDFLVSIIKEDNNAYQNTCRLVRSVYGEEAEKILLERPELSMDDIPNFDIFDEKIRETIGYGGVHTFLTYYMSSEHIITELAQNQELIRYYIEFEKITQTFYPPSAIGLEDRLLAFDKHRELIKSIVDSAEKNAYTNDLLLMLRDEEGYSMLSDYYGISPFSPNADLEVDTLEELLKYRERREKVLKTYIDESANNPELTGLIRRIIMFKHFGIIENSPGQYNDYDHKKILQDYLQFNKTQLSEDEIDLIEIYAILEDIESQELLLQIDGELSNRTDVVTPVRMKAIDAKVVQNYKSEYVDSLITLEQARKMAEDPENKSYRYICKENGDICYPEYMHCSNDNSKKYKNYIIQEDGTRVTQYQGANGEEVTVKRKENFNSEIIESYEIKNILIVPKDGRTPYSIDIQVTLKNGELYEYFWPIQEANERYGLRKKTFYEMKDVGEGFPKEKKYSYTYTTPIHGNDNAYFLYKIPNGNHGWIRTACSYDNQIMQKNNLYFAEGNEQDISFINSVKMYRDSIEEYLKGVVKEIQMANDEKKTPPYFRVVHQYNPNKVEFEEGDVEGFVLYGVNANQLCISMQRGGVTSEKLASNKLFQGKLENGLGGQEFTGDVHEQIYIEKRLEGGLPSKSFYYSCNNSNNPNYGIGLGISNIDPNAIIGFHSHDAGTSHLIKRLRVYMDKHRRISDIISEQSKATIHAELATLRNEYDISKIKERNCRR